MNVSDGAQIVLAIPVAAAILGVVGRKLWKAGKSIAMIAAEMTPDGGTSLKDQVVKAMNDSRDALIITKRIRFRQRQQHEQNTAKIGTLEKGMQEVLHEQAKVRGELNDFKVRWAVPREDGKQ